MQPSEEDKQRAYAAAAKDLVNIDPPERKRRIILGSVLSVSFVPSSENTEHPYVTCAMSIILAWTYHLAGSCSRQCDVAAICIVLEKCPPHHDQDQ